MKSLKYLFCFLSSAFICGNCVFAQYPTHIDKGNEHFKILTYPFTIKPFDLNKDILKPEVNSMKVQNIKGQSPQDFYYLKLYYKSKNSQ